MSKTYILPFEETMTGWYEIEANSLEHAKEIVRLGDFTEYAEPQYRHGTTDWDLEKIYLAPPKLKVVK